MFERISIKDIIAFNNSFDEGEVLNHGSLEFVVYQANKTQSWIRACAYLVRAILIDHVFKEGNKRTAAAVIISFLEDNSLTFHPENVARTVTRIIEKNITSVSKIEMEIKNVVV